MLEDDTGKISMLVKDGKVASKGVSKVVEQCGGDAKVRWKF
jgi:hypothetical protein